MSKTITLSSPFSKVNGITINRSKPCKSTNYTACDSRKIDYIVLHYTGNKADSAKNNANYFANNKVEASAHYFVDASEIWLSVGVKDKAWAVGNDTYVHDKCRNSNSVSIEMCTSGNYKIADKTIENAAYLCAELCKTIGVTADKVDTYVLRHWDVTHKNCPAQMSGANNSEWTAFKAKVKAILGGETTATKTEATKTVKIELKQLSNGMTDTQVKTLRRILRSRGWKDNSGNILTVDTVFNDKLEGALRKFQKAKGLEVDGICGEKTWNALLKT